MARGWHEPFPVGVFREINMEGNAPGSRRLRSALLKTGHDPYVAPPPQPVRVADHLDERQTELTTERGQIESLLADRMSAGNDLASNEVRTGSPGSLNARAHPAFRAGPLPPSAPSACSAMKQGSFSSPINSMDTHARRSRLTSAALRAMLKTWLESPVDAVSEAGPRFRAIRLGRGDEDNSLQRRLFGGG